jgi:hypothetical protein
MIQICQEKTRRSYSALCNVRRRFAKRDAMPQQFNFIAREPIPNSLIIVGGLAFSELEEGQITLNSK